MILAKALDVIELLEESHAPVSLEDVFQRTKISKTSVYRILKTLVHRGYVAQAQNGLTAWYPVLAVSASASPSRTWSCPSQPP